MDQGIGLLSEIARTASQRSDANFWLVSECAVSFVLVEGEHVIRNLKLENLFTPNIGVLPIFGPAVITTRGLEWNVQDWQTEMGGNVSTSNHVTDQEVHIRVKHRSVLFTVETAVGGR